MRGYALVLLAGCILGCSEALVAEPSSLATVDVTSTDNAVGGDVEHSAQKLSGLCDGPWDCDDGNSCTYDACLHDYGKNQDVCYYILSKEYCDDGNPCTTEDVCEFGSCLGGKLTSCGDDNACTVDTCTFDKGCAHAQKNCNDDDVWTADFCSNGTCKSEQLQLAVYQSIVVEMPESIPPNSYAPVVYMGDENLEVFNPTDKWVALSAVMPYGIWFRGYCEGGFVKKPHWDAGYVVSKNGWQVEQKMVGGHAVGMKIGYFVSQWEVQEVGEQPTLLPLSGTQEVDAGGNPIPEHYISPNLKKICEKMAAAQKKSGG